jgi:hypothetical protein
MWTLIAVIGIVLAGVFVTTYFVRGALEGEKLSLLGVGQGQYKRNAGVLWALILVSIVHALLLRYVHTLTGITMLDGAIGVALGLYICAHPAANAVNTLFFERHLLRQIASDRATIRWLALNLMALLAGWMSIYIGLTRLVVQTG